MRYEYKVVSNNGRLNFLIRRNQRGYKSLVTILEEMRKKGVEAWYGDVEDMDGKEQCGIVLTFKGK